MLAEILDGKRIADQIHAETRAEAEQLKARGVTPGLAVVLVGEDPASKVYVTNKEKMAGELGFFSLPEHLPADTSEAELLRVVDELNSDRRIHGVLVQSPLPKPLREELMWERILPAKDVDGFHPMNLGRLAAGQPCLVACTPAGVIEMLVRSGVAISGKNAVIVGRSIRVGRPLQLLLSQKSKTGDATVTVCHSRTPDIGAFTRQADILIAAIGQARFVKASMVKPGAVVIDVGINAVPVLNPDGTPAISEKTGKPRTKLVGDVDFDAVKEVASKISPVPGGVGPLTIAMLMKNTVRACRQMQEAAA
ncbi:MAG: bifunctional 5,10-methylene-tetrahydrofolate dehydrogenase/5,10-methylene-tetrahydrofolate cyclohydrolase [Verrucomicrobia bacterium]|nr:bifunctional 5,10-methylene-tetrahydrofolate dehydrogenase/5,10-methylene-tetrahydrofolate cyclohydrolase [Verrucomicrobiota bacterium]